VSNTYLFFLIPDLKIIHIKKKSRKHQPLCGLCACLCFPWVRVSLPCPCWPWTLHPPFSASWEL
jgi:hypothetical protein